MSVYDVVTDHAIHVLSKHLLKSVNIEYHMIFPYRSLNIFQEDNL